MLKNRYSESAVIEVGCDEAGRGCLAGPVFAAAVILPDNFFHPLLNDSKKVSPRNRYLLRSIIQEAAIAYSVASATAMEIDNINILNASILAMHRALDSLNTQFHLILVDGNRFKPYLNIPFECIIKGDGQYASIAAASILAKTYRDDYMIELHNQYPDYHWNKNKGYPTAEHFRAISNMGISPHHRKTFCNRFLQISIQF
jgi:ribonuclease HII